MSQENVEITRQTLDAFNRGDKGAWLAMFDPDAEMVPAPEWPENAPIRGAEAIWDFYVEVTGAWEEGLSEFGEVINAGADKVVAKQPSGRTRQDERCGCRVQLLDCWHLPERKGGPYRMVRRSSQGPRSRQAPGVGDVAGARRGPAAGLRGLQSTGYRRMA